MSRDLKFENVYMHMQYILNVKCILDMICQGDPGRWEGPDVSVRDRGTYSRTIKRYIRVPPKLILASPSHPHPCSDSTLCKMNTT